MSPCPSDRPGRRMAAASFIMARCSRSDGELWMWYLGMGDQDEDRPLSRLPRQEQGRQSVGKARPWSVEYGGNRHNNLVDLDQGRFKAAGCVVYYEPDETDAGRRFKMVFTGSKYPGLLFGVAYSPDGVHWTESPNNPRGAIKLEPQGGIKWRGLLRERPGGMSLGSRRLDSPWSPMFPTILKTGPRPRHWVSPRSAAAPPRRTHRRDRGEAVHLGAALWNRGNIIIGFYGQWHGESTNDRRWVPMDLGLVVSHDALHFSEPIPDFRIVQAAENTSSWLPSARPPRWSAPRR